MKIRSVTRQRHRHHAARTRHPLDDQDISSSLLLFNVVIIENKNRIQNRYIQQRGLNILDCFADSELTNKVVGGKRQKLPIRGKGVSGGRNQNTVCSNFKTVNIFIEAFVS